MKTKSRQTHDSENEDDQSGSGFVPSSPNLRINPNNFTLSFRVVEPAHGQSDWVVYQLGEARIPPTPLWGDASKLRDHPDYFWMIAAALDVYLLRQRETKSRHLIAVDCANTLIKLIEYALIQGFYKVQDAPKEAWSTFASELSNGGWIKALDIERRTIDVISETENPMDLVRTNGRRSGGWSISASLLDKIGTNIASTELNAINKLITQSLVSSECAKSGDPSKYKLLPAKKLKQSILTQYLRTLNLLADVQAPWGLKFVPIPNIVAYVRKNGEPNGRTQNFDPTSLAQLLKHSYQWIVHYGPTTIDFMQALIVQLAGIYGQSAREDYGYQFKPEMAWRQFQFKRSVEILRSLPEREILEAKIDKKIHSFNKSSKTGDGVAVDRVLDELYSACFCVLILMNGRRKDEISHSSIGMYRDGLRQIDEELNLYEFDFYVEKTYRTYIPFYINDISRKAIEVLDSLSGLALGWAQMHDPNLKLSEKKDKLFTYPSIGRGRGSGQVGRLMWYSFNSATKSGRANGFVTKALEPIGIKMRVSPHMFRRAYGTIFIYRYEHADLVALAQQYGHLDVKMAMTYVTDGSHTPVGKSLAALWSAPRHVIEHARKNHAISLAEEIREAGIQRIRDLVDEVVVKGVRYGGGFTRLINRFHSKLGSRLDYSNLSVNRQAETLSNAMLSRGHLIEPLLHASCLAGDMRRGAACSDKAGRPQRHTASPETCGGCPYSLIASGHLDSLKQEAERLGERLSKSRSTVQTLQAQMTLKSLQRVIALQSKRLGMA